VHAFAVKEKVSAVMSVSKATIPTSFFMMVLLFSGEHASEANGYGASARGDVRWITFRKSCD
jgi:hypothetical protein